MDILNASATQTSDDNGKSKWVVKSQTGEIIYSLDKTMNEKQAMAAIHIARFFAKKAMEEGLAVSNNKHKLYVEGIMDRGQKQIDLLNEQITGLSNELLKHMEEV